MIPVSSGVATAIESTTREWRARIVYNGSDIGCNIRNFKITGGSNANNSFNIGTCVSSILELTVDNVAGFAWQDKEVQVQVSVKPYASTWISLGYFTITRVERSQYQTALTGYGRLAAKFSAAYAPPQPIPVNWRIPNQISDLASQVGITITIDSGLNLSDLSTIVYPRGATCRDVLQLIALTVGGFAYEKYDGTVHLGKYSSTSTYTLPANRMTSAPRFADYDYTVSGVRIIYRDAYTSVDGTEVPAAVYESGSAPFLTWRNIYMNVEVPTKCALAAGNVIGLTWRPCTIDLALGDPRFEPRDVLTVADLSGTTHIVPCHNYQHTFDGGFKTTVVAYAMSDAESTVDSSWSGGGSAGGSGTYVTGGVQSVTVTPALTSGTAIGTIAVDGTSETLYAPTPPTAYTSAPPMDGTGSAGTSIYWARGNHVHPSDTSKQDVLVSGTNIKTVNGNSLLGSGDITITGGGGQNTFSGSCLTTAATATKVVNSSEWVDAHGNIIAVRFTYGNTAQNPYLNINNTGARLIYTSDGVAVDLAWEDGDILTFMRGLYGGGTVCYWLLSKASTLDVADDAYDLADSKSTVSYTPTQTSGTAIGTLTIDNVANTLYAPSSGGTRTTWYATSTSSATNALTASTTSHDFSLTAGNVVHVLFSNAPNNSTNPFTLNVDGTGAKTIYGSGGQSSTITKAWAANDVVSFVYSGTNFRIIDAVRATTSNYGETILSSLHNSSAEDVAATSKAVKDAYDLASSKSTVSWSQSQSSGTKIATVTIDGTPTDVYAPSGGGGGSYTATAPIDITNNVISHDTSGVTAGTYDGGWVKGTGFYLPSFTVDAKGHVTAASDLGQAIPVIASGVSTESAFLLYGYQYNYLPRAASNYGNDFLLSAGNTTATFTLYDYASISPYYMRVVSVEAVDTTTGEKVLVDWTTNYPISTAGKTNSITLSVSIANAYTHNIAIIPMVGYATAGM